MRLPTETVIGSYDFRLVALSIFIAVVVSFTAFNLAGRVTQSSGSARRRWWLAGAVTMGLGIWSMHFVGMLAFRMDMPVVYDVARTLMSMVPGVAASAIALHIASRSRLTSLSLMAGGVFMGLGISTMHFVGMSAMRMNAFIEYDPTIFLMAVVLAIATSWAALWLAFSLRESSQGALNWQTVGSAHVMGGAIAGMHYMGMAAASFIVVGIRRPVDMSGGLDPTSLATIVATVTLAVVALALLVSFYDRRLGLQAMAQTNLLRKAKEELEERVRERTAELEEANRALQHDIAARRRIESALYQEKERAQVTLHSIGDAVISTDQRGIIQYINPVCEYLTGWRRREAKGRPLGDVFMIRDEQTGERANVQIEDALREGMVMRSTDIVLVHRGGDEIPIAVTASPIRDSDGSIIGVVVVFHDVSETRRMARQLYYQASHDALTGLVNRREFERRVEAAITSAQLEGEHHALCYLDLDQFKLVNDTCGHVAGDELLRQLTVLLQDQVRGSDTVARLGGDEFGILLEGCTLANAREIAEQVRQAIREFRFVWAERTFELGVSIGLVAIDEHTLGKAELLSAADVACYAAKDMGRNRVHVYEPDDIETIQREGEMQLVSRITQAIGEGRFRLFVQRIIPTVPHADARQHFEILLRMEDEAGDLVSPGVFIPAAERYNLMPAIDRWVVTTVVEEISSLDAWQSGLVFSINLSGTSLNDDHFLDFVRLQLDSHHVAPEAICFEVTETAAIANLAKVSHFIREMKEIGCGFSLDDFGSGLSSFGYLKNLPVDYLKIDGGFVRDMMNDPIDAAFVEAINHIGHVMGKKTIAEFVEDRALLAQLAELGVDYAQGYGIEMPCPFESVIPAALADVSKIAG